MGRADERQRRCACAMVLGLARFHPLRGQAPYEGRLRGDVHDHIGVGHIANHV